MSIDTRELDHIRQEIDRLHDRSNTNKAQIAAQEAVAEERYEHLLQLLQDLRKNIQKMDTAVARLENLATQGRTSLKTVLWLGGAVGAITAFLATLSEYYGK